ncbi:hypothetical protein V8C35DRAFT_4154 [Trichoderma chlorosporum]
MALPRGRLVATFSRLPNELRLKIWEAALESPRVYRVELNDRLDVSTSEDLKSSTAAARSALGVSRVDRNLILKHILPDEIPLPNTFRRDRNAKGCEGVEVVRYNHDNVVRYNAAKDVICLIWPTSTIWWHQFQRIRHVHLPITFSRTRYTTVWMNKVQKLALEMGPREPAERVMEYVTRNPLSDFFTGWKQLYIVISGKDGEEEEETETEDSLFQGMPEDMMTLEMFMTMKIKAPAPMRNDDAFLHTNIYIGTSGTDMYLSGRAALQGLGSRRHNDKFIQKIEEYNEQEPEARSIGPMADVKVSVMLHVTSSFSR